MLMVATDTATRTRGRYRLARLARIDAVTRRNTEIGDRLWGRLVLARQSRSPAEDAIRARFYAATERGSKLHAAWRRAFRAAGFGNLLDS